MSNEAKINQGEVVQVDAKPSAYRFYDACVTTRRALLACGLVVVFACFLIFTAAPSRAWANSVEIYGLDATALQQLLSRGEITSVQLVTAYLKRIAAYEFAYGNQPGLNAITNLNAAVITDAQQSDKERAAGKIRGPLHGIPILVKDVIDVKGLPTTDSLEALRNYVPAEDATQVRLLREAGAIIIGKTNVLYIDGRGNSSFGGNTRNPYDQSRHPGFSSGGSGAGVAAGFATLSLAEDTFGSVRIPAALNNLVGLRPTIGLTSAKGLQRMSWAYDTLGPIALSVRDVALVMDATVRYDPNDPISVKVSVSAGGYGRFLNAEFLKGKRIGVIKALFAADNPPQKATSETLRLALAEMKKLGATVIDVELPDDIIKAQNAIGRAILAYEIPMSLNAYFGKNVGDISDLASLAPPVDKVTRADILVYSGKIKPSDTKAVAGADSPPVPESQYKEALAAEKRFKSLLTRYITENKFDALAYPTMQQPASKIGVSDPFISTGRLAAQAGLPALSIPAGFVDGLPVGIDLMGLPFTEAELLGMGYAFEQGTHHRSLPKTTPPLLK